MGCKEKVCNEGNGHGKTGLSIQDMTELIQIHEAYKALNTALFGGEVSLMYYEGYIGALGRIYEIIDRNILKSNWIQGITEPEGFRFEEERLEKAFHAGVENTGK